MKTTLKILVLSIIYLLITFSEIKSQPSVLFVLPGETSYVASRTYNYFTSIYRGKVSWIDAKDFDANSGNGYNSVVKMTESINDLGMVSMMIQLTNNGSRSVRSIGGSYNSNISMADIYKLQALELAFDFVKEFDPEYFKHIKDALKDVMDDD